MNLFIIAPINVINAQNINGLDIMRFAGKRGYKVRALAFANGGAMAEGESSQVWWCRRPYRLTTPLAIARGISWADCIYCPKPDLFPGFSLRLAQLLSKPMFSTIETVLDQSLGGATLRKLVDFYGKMTLTTSITEHIRESCERVPGLAVSTIVTPLGNDASEFSKYRFVRQSVKRIAFVGSDPIRKGYGDFLTLAESFPGLEFYSIGGLSRCEDPALISRHSTLTRQNLRYFGAIPRAEMAKVLSGADLLYLPSRVEGFPKVILESGASGIPSIVYPDYGADAWIKRGSDGFIVDDVNGAINLVRLLLSSPEQVEVASRGAAALADRFVWSKTWPLWDEAIKVAVSIRS